MKVVNSKFDKGGDSVFRTRLLHCLDHAGIPLKKIMKLRENVYLVYSYKDIFILKGFANKNRLLLQKNFTNYLRETGFTQSYIFYDEPANFKHSNSYFAWIEYIHPSSEKFSYKQVKDRQEGLQLLTKYHLAAADFEHLNKTTYNQLKKWKERLSLFKKNIQVLEKYVSQKILSAWLYWGYWAIEGMEKYEHLLWDDIHTVIHGDVAHHNFLRKTNGELYLIDFDLISYGPALFDYLQYGNRILPYIQNEDELWDYPQFNQYKNNRAFLYALAFPADIFREWNRIVRENLVHNHSYLHSIWKLTVEDFSKRMEFNETLAFKVNQQTNG
jgi:thiamine kinase-like enzyme